MDKFTLEIGDLLEVRLRFLCVNVRTGISNNEHFQNNRRTEQLLWSNCVEDKYMTSCEVRLDQC